VSAGRLSPRARKAVLTVHVGVSVALIGVTASVLIVALTAAGAESAGDAHALYSSAQTLAFALAIPFSLMSLATGLALGLGTRWGVLTYWWVTSKLALQLAIILTGALVVRPGAHRPHRRRPAARRGAVGADDRGGCEPSLRRGCGRSRGVQAGRAPAPGAGHRRVSRGIPVLALHTPQQRR
jgi:hypothetical protein